MRIPTHTSVLPAVNTNSTMNIGVELENGARIHGQHDISHPNLPITHSPVNRSGQFANPAQNQAQQNLNLVVDKNNCKPLDAKIKRLFYLNEDHQEIIPACNPSVLRKIREQDSIVYALGSLWTRYFSLFLLHNMIKDESIP